MLERKHTSSLILRSRLPCSLMLFLTRSRYILRSLMGGYGQIQTPFEHLYIS